jgi:hypothetical protein
MDFPLGFPDGLKPRTEVAVLKACRKFRDSNQIGPRVEVGLDAFAKIVIVAVGAGEIDIGVAHIFLNQFLDYLFVNDPFGSGIAPFGFSRHIFSQMKEHLKRSDRWIGYMEKLDAITRPKRAKAPKKRKLEKHKRLTGTVHSPRAAERVEQFCKDRGIGMTEFAIQAGTTDRTLRSFRKTGRVRRSILDGIAKVMRTTREKLIAD